MTEEIVGERMYAYKKVRKHVSQMSSKEKDMLRDMFNEIDNWEIFSHVKDRIKQKNYHITDEDFQSIIKNGKIIEYQQKYYVYVKRLSHLVVLQSIREDENGVKDRMHMVFDMNDKGVVSVWLNSYEDTHETLDFGIYSKGLKVGEKYW